MDEARLAVASNLIRLRTDAGMTQAELGEKLNYSDKTISKWERAEAIPDAFVLKQIGELFHVSVDFLLRTHDQWEMPEGELQTGGYKYSSAAITIVSITSIWTLAVLAFAVFWILGSIYWHIFAYAVPVSLITLLVLNSVFNEGKHNYYIVSALVLSVVAITYISLIKFQPWQLFLVVIPAELLVFLCFKIRKRKKEP